MFAPVQFSDFSCNTLCTGPLVDVTNTKGGSGRQHIKSMREYMRRVQNHNREALKYLCCGQGPGSTGCMKDKHSPESLEFNMDEWKPEYTISNSAEKGSFII